MALKLRRINVYATSLHRSDVDTALLMRRHVPAGLTLCIDALFEQLKQSANGKRWNCQSKVGIVSPIF